MLTSSRRQFLAASTSASALALTSQLTQLAEANNNQAASWIDAHVHVWTPDTTRYPLSSGYKKSDMQPASFTPEELFAQCRPHGVERIVLIQMSY